MNITQIDKPQTKALILRDDASLKISFTDTAKELRNQALEISGLIGRVASAEDQDRAVAAQTSLNDVVKTVEKARKEVKEPVLTFGRAIDDAAKDFVVELREELTRISGLIGDFQTLEQARVRAAEAARRLEEQKLEAERKAAEQAVIEARRVEQAKLDEQARKAAQALAAARSAKARQEAEALQREIDGQKALAAAQSHDALDAVNEHFNRQAADLPITSAVRAEGQIIRNDWEIIVVDINLLAKCHRNCVEIKPKLSEIKELLKLGVDVKGILATPKVNSGVRAGGTRAIEV